MKTRNNMLIALATLMAVGTVSAEPRTAIVNITSMRPYTTGNYYVTVSSSTMAVGDPCTTVYKVSDDTGAKAVIASLLTAYALDAQIQIEVPTTGGCTGWGTEIASVFLL